MNCPSCGRILANNAKCVYCGQGTQVRKREELQIPEGTTKRPAAGFPWGRLVVFLILGGAVAAAFLHPELNAKIRALIP
jgi:hypothetical protein